MKNKKLNKLFILALPLALACGLFAPSISFEKSSADSDAPIEISTAGDLLNIVNNVDKNYKLTSNITLSDSSLTSIGGSGNPFTGTFDGNGYTITNLSLRMDSGVYQGLFGYTSGAIIKNLRIEGAEFQGEVAVSQIYCGAIVGYATNNTQILNCEVDNITPASPSEGVEIPSNTFTHKVTYGGIAGYLSNSTIKDSVVYRDQIFKINYTSTNTSSIGGVVGIADNASVLQNVLNFGDIIVDNTNNEISNPNYVGGIVGSVNDTATTFKNVVSGGALTVNENPDVSDTNYIGGLIGYIANTPSKGNIASCAYIQNVAAYGEDGGYKAKNLATNDYVAKLPASAVRLNDFYFESNDGFIYSFDSVDKTFMWHPTTIGWSTDLWVMCDVELSETSSETQIRLQQFEYFEIELAETIDYTGLFEKVATSEDSTKVTTVYGDYRKLAVKYITSSDKDYYDVSGVKHGTEICEYESHLDKEYTEAEIDAFSQSDDVALFKTSIGFVLKIKSTSQTAGEYSFEMIAKEFNGYLAAEDGGSVRFSGGTLTTRKFNINSLQVSAIATPNSTSAFSGWTLYRLTTSAVAMDGDKVKTGYYKDTTNNLYWEKVSEVYNYTTGESVIIAGNKSGNVININFGGVVDNCIKIDDSAKNNYLKEDFLFVASFESDPYKLKVEKNNDNAKDYIRSISINSIDMATNSYAAISREDVVTIVVKVDAQYAIDEKALEKSIQKDNRPKVTIEVTSEKVEEEKEVTVYTISFSAKGLSSDKATDTQKRTFVLSLELNEVEEEENPYLLWIILGSSIGGATVLGLLIWFIVKKILARKFKGKKVAKVSKASKKEDKPVNYKDFF